MGVSCMSKKEKKQKAVKDWQTDVKLDIPEEEIIKALDSVNILKVKDSTKLNYDTKSLIIIFRQK